MTRAREPLIALVGNPNSGKTTLFNGLTGLSARVGNYPGITVEHREGLVTLEGGGRARVLDLPGTYSLVPRADDEVVALRGVLGSLPGSRPPDLVVAVVDASALERNLYAVAQLRELGLPMVVALTMMDVLDEDGLTLDLAALEARLGAPVIRASTGARGDGEGLRAALEASLASEPVAPLEPPCTDALDPDAREKLRALGERIAADLALPVPPLTLGLWALSARAMETHDRLGLSDARVRELLELAPDPDWVRRAIEARYRRAAAWCEGVLTRVEAGARTRSQRFTDAVDKVALHPVLGPIALLVVFGALFQALFSWASPLMDGIEAGMAYVAALVSAAVPESLPLARSVLVDGVVKGVGNVVVFVPQIAVLFLFLGLLEDSGYLARAAFLLDRLMAKVGLHGRAFVPLLSGFACAVPAILATRTIENTKDRFVTILVTPLVSCSARLPVYALMIATVFATVPPVFGVVHAGTVVMIAMYLLGIGMAIAMAALFKRTLLKSPRPALVLELPPYRVPRLRDVLRHTLSRVRIFLAEAGTVILAITVVLWGLFTFPRSDELKAAYEAERAAIATQQLDDDTRSAALQRAEGDFKRRSVEQSAAGRVGKLIEPVIEPLGFDWKIGVGLIASFAAREVLVSTLGLVYGLGEGSDEESRPLREAMRRDVHARTGKPVYTPLTGLSLMVFFVLAMQCMSTLAVVRRETRSWRWPAFLFGYMTLLAYAGSLLVFQGGRLLGFA